MSPPGLSPVLPSGIPAWPRRPPRSRLAAAAARLQLGLVDVAAAAHQGVADRTLVRAEHRPVAVVELLDDLVGPAVGEHVAPHELVLEAVGQRRLAGGAQLLEHRVELEVGLADELVERVEMAASALERLERLGHA